MATTPRRKADRRKRRPDNGGNHAILQARVDPTTKELANAGAEARNWTLSRYIQELVEADQLAREFLARKQDQGELPIELTKAS